MTVRTFLVVAVVVAVVGLLAGCPKPGTDGSEPVAPVAEPMGDPEPPDDPEATTDDTDEVEPADEEPTGEEGSEEETAEEEGTEEEPEDTDAAEETAHAEDETLALVKTKCGECHELTRVETHDPAEEAWEDVVAEMQEKKEDWISDEEAEAIIAALNEHHPAS